MLTKVFLQKSIKVGVSLLCKCGRELKSVGLTWPSCGLEDTLLCHQKDLSNRAIILTTTTLMRLVSLIVKLALEESQQWPQKEPRATTPDVSNHTIAIRLVSWVTESEKSWGWKGPVDKAGLQIAQHTVQGRFECPQGRGFHKASLWVPSRVFDHHQHEKFLPNI